MSASGTQRTCLAPQRSTPIGRTLGSGYGLTVGSPSASHNQLAQSWARRRREFDHEADSIDEAIQRPDRMVAKAAADCSGRVMSVAGQQAGPQGPTRLGSQLWDHSITLLTYAYEFDPGYKTAALKLGSIEWLFWVSNATNRFGCRPPKVLPSLRAGSCHTRRPFHPAPQKA
jgi:hypothetical protein